MRCWLIEIAGLGVGRGRLFQRSVSTACVTRPWTFHCILVGGHYDVWWFFEPLNSVNNRHGEIAVGLVDFYTVLKGEKRCYG